MQPEKNGSGRQLHTDLSFVFGNRQLEFDNNGRKKGLSAGNNGGAPLSWWQVSGQLDLGLAGARDCLQEEARVGLKIGGKMELCCEEAWPVG